MVVVVVQQLRCCFGLVASKFGGYGLLVNDVGLTFTLIGYLID